MESSRRTDEATTTGAAAPAGSATAPTTRAVDPAAGGAATGADPQDRSPGPVAALTIEGVTVSCLMNAHYHGGREAFLDTVHRWFMFGVIALGAAALVDVIAGPTKEPIKALCAAGAALLGALDLTFDLSNRARMHSMMKRRYFDLLADVREGRKTLAEGKVCLERYSGDEEPPYRVLLLACWNLAQRGVYGFEARSFAVTRRAMLFKNFFRRPGAHFRVIDPARSR